MRYIESPIVPYFKGDQFRSAVELMNLINQEIRCGKGHDPRTGTVVYETGYEPPKVILAFIKVEFEAPGFWHVDFNRQKKSFTLTPKLGPGIIEGLQ
jgi:hypothetical protein